MSVKGNKRETKEGRELYVGLAPVRVVAINPTRAELNELFGREADEEKSEIKYVDTDDKGDARVRLSFWLHDSVHDKYFVQSIYLNNRVTVSKNGDKCQIVNSTCDCTYVPFETDEDGSVTDTVNESVIPDWFTNFTNKKTGEILGEKTWRKALVGESDLCTFLRGWLGGIKWNHKDTEVCIDLQRLFKEDFRELRELINSGYDKPFIILTGVKTTESGEKYQEIFKGAYLDGSFWSNIQDNVTFNTTYGRDEWARFVTKTQGQYGFKHFHTLRELSVYDPNENPVDSNVGRPATQPASNEY